MTLNHFGRGHIPYLMVSIFVLAGCDSYISQQYQPNPQNTIALQNVASQGKRANVANVYLAEGVSSRPTCRLAGPIDLGAGNDAATVVRQAILAEFLASGVYRANGAPLSFTLTKLNPDTASGTWTIAFNVSSPKGSMSVERITKYSTSFTAVAACNNTATAFNQALSLTILDMVQNPNFARLL